MKASAVIKALLWAGLCMAPSACGMDFADPSGDNGGGDDGDGSDGNPYDPELVSPNDPNALSGVLVIPGATRVSGAPPLSNEGQPGAPSIQSGGSLEVVSGNQAVLSVQYYSETGYNNCYVQVSGASDYFVIESSNIVQSGELQIPIDFPSNVDAGSFSFYTCIAGANGLVSNPVSTPVRVSTSSSAPEQPYDPGTPSGDYTCSGYNTVNSCTIQFCLSSSLNDCYYEANGQRFGCSSCQDLTPCAQAVTDYAIDVCY